MGTSKERTSGRGSTNELSACACGMQDSEGQGEVSMHAHRTIEVGLR